MPVILVDVLRQSARADGVPPYGGVFLCDLQSFHLRSLDLKHVIIPENAIGRMIASATENTCTAIVTVRVMHPVRDIFSPGILLYLQQPPLSLGHRRPKGCRCKPINGKYCRTLKCPCFKAGRECDPELCNKCEARYEILIFCRNFNRTYQFKRGKLVELCVRISKSTNYDVVRRRFHEVS